MGSVGQVVRGQVRWLGLVSGLYGVSSSPWFACPIGGNRCIVWTDVLYVRYGSKDSYDGVNANSNPIGYGLVHLVFKVRTICGQLRWPQSWGTRRKAFLFPLPRWKLGWDGSSLSIRAAARNGVTWHAHTTELPILTLSYMYGSRRIKNTAMERNLLAISEVTASSITPLLYEYAHE